MKRIISIILLSASLFAGNLEVDGGLSVTGAIQSPTIDALRDDGNYEYKMYYVVFPTFCNWDSYTYISQYKSIDFQDSGNDWLSKINTLGNDGWSLIFQSDMMTDVSGALGPNDASVCYGGQLYLMTLRRPIEE